MITYLVQAFSQKKEYLLVQKKQLAFVLAIEE